MDRLVDSWRPTHRGLGPGRGAKNAALPQIAAALLCSDRLELSNVPEVTDVATMLALMAEFGVSATRGPGLVAGAGRGAQARNAQAPYDTVRKMRATVLVLAPLLARFGQARVSLPGGCAIGARPVDMHVAALAALGARIAIENGSIVARAKGDRCAAAISS